jgi:AcrR family transcriptional regulator
MEAAVRLAGRNGFAQTRVSDIVGRVGVGQGVFYWYFESKDALFQEILADGRRRLRRFQAAFIDSEPDPIRRVAKGIVASIDFIVHNRHVYAFLGHASREPGRRLDREAQRVHVLDVARHIGEAMASGAVRSGNAEVMAHGVAAIVERVAWLCVLTGADVDDMTQGALDFALGGLLGGGGLALEDLRREMEMTPDLLELRDRVGLLGPQDRTPVRPRRRNGRSMSGTLENAAGA